MSLHRSLKTKPAALNQHRNVLTRAERIARLTELGRFTRGEDTPVGLVKVGNIKVVTKKKKKEETTTEEDAGTETEAAS